MSTAKILVPISGLETDSVALGAALTAAKPFAAHVQALFVPADPRMSAPYGAPISPAVVDAIVTALETANRDAAKCARQMVADAAKAQGATICAKAQRTDRVTCSLKEDMGMYASRTGRHARLSDLVVFSSLPSDILSDANAALVETLIRAGRPVLIAPVVPKSLTDKISAAWDGSAACAHALSSAMPFLRHAAKVELLEIDPVSGNGVSADEAKEYLALHQVPAEMRRIKRDKHTTAEVILHEAAAGGASLLVMGGYGHSRFSEAMFGGVSFHIKWHATLPVFMAH